MRVKFCVVLSLSLLVCVPHLAMAAAPGMHYFDCKECHLANLPVADLLGNICLKCHDTGALETTLNPGAPHGTSAALSDGKFAAGADPSNLYNTATAAVGQTSHNWYAPSVNAEAGAVEPNRTLHPTMFGMRGRNVGTVNCSRCHDPHGAYDLVNNPSLLVASDDRLSTMAANDLCTACHANFAGAMSLPGNSGLLTHPLLNSAQLAAVQADGAKAPNYTNMTGTLPLYNSTSPYTNNVQLVEGGVSCMSCHGLHFTDSNAATTDGPAIVSPGDGLLLRSDGPTSTGTGTSRYNTAQLRSNLCQSCHTYNMHGNPASTHNVGCLDCHGGHSYNGGTPSLYVLASQSPDAVPTRLQKVYQSDVQVNYPVYNSVHTRGNAASGRVRWDDDVAGTALGFCEVCHGDTNDMTPNVGLGTKSPQHEVGAVDECASCHKHNDVDFAFKLDASAISCGGCHGFPPFKDIIGLRAAPYDANDGGYATDADLTYNYNSSSTHYKPESTTAHKTHAGHDLKADGGLTDLPGADRWYFYGSTGIENCKLCHGPTPTDPSTHQTGVGTATTTFRNVPFDGIAAAPGQPSPNYDAANANCDNVYCHSVGGPRLPPSGIRDYSLGNTAANTPSWHTGGGGGYNSIIGTGASRCTTCHGNDATTMQTMGNSWQSHAGHYNTTIMSIGTNCNICHANTAIDKDTLTANAVDHRAGSGGEHVNGVQDVSYNATILSGKLAGEVYNPAGDGTCSVYCHDAPEPGFPNGTGRSADWDTIGTMTCNSCHADQTTTFTGSHQRHSATNVNGPKLTCAECHGTGSDSGTHSGHVDGIVNYITLSAGDLTLFGTGYPQNICDRCHGYSSSDTEVAVEIQPVWGVPSTTDCATCHAGSICGAAFNNGQAQDPDHLGASRSGGHNRLAASGPYNSGNLAANADCDACHITDSPNHWDGTNYDATGLEADLMLRTGLDGYNSAYLGGLENNYCLNCHGNAPAHPTRSASSANNLGIKTHNTKKCVACHNVHGDDVSNNIQMIWSDRTAQNQHDDTFGQYRTTNVVFTNNSDFTGIGLNSYDEDDGADGAATESNSDDVCAVCHSNGTVDANFIANPVSHNNIEGTGTHSGSDNLGTDCFISCHAVHNDPGGAFLASAGTSCNGCHGYPPTTAAHNMHAVEEGSRTAIDTDDQSDCENCHTGASSYTYSTTNDQGNLLNHSNKAGRRSILFNSVGFAKGAGNKWTCATACHNTDTTDGYWYTWDDVTSPTLAVASRLPIDTDGLACNKCHYYAVAGSESRTGNTNHGSVGDGRAESISTSHNEHFEKGVSCGACHDITGVEYNSASIAGPLAHIDDRTGANRGAVYNGAALATQDEAGFDEGLGVRDVVRPGMTFDNNNTCSGGITTGCHASGTPDWDIPIPATSAGCVMCHTNTTVAAYNPTSGLHNNAAAPPVTGNSHDGSFDDGSAGTADCVTCHSASPTVTAANHIDGTLQAGAVISYNAAVMTYNTAVNTCTTSCHSAGTMWAYKWSSTSYNSDGTQCANCHGRWGDWRTGVTHRMNSAPQSAHGTGTLGCKDCHALQAATGYTFTSGSADWNANIGETSNHGDGLITMNNNTTQYGRNGTGLSGCAECHAAYDGTATGQYAFVTTTWTNSVVLGEAIPVTCSSCHGGTTYTGPSASNYWPDGPGQDDLSKNNSGAHAKHILELAKSVYPNDIGVNDAATYNSLLTNNTASYLALTSEQKQIELCAYCHAAPGVNPGHNDDALPAETLASANDVNTPGQGFYELWEVPRVSRDSADYDTTGTGSCYVSSCHNNKATDATATNYGWYNVNDGDCVMCHLDVTNGAVANSNGGTHVAHMNAATLFGMTIACNDCHGPGAVDWDSNAPTISDGVAPTSNHIDGTFAVNGGSVIDGTTQVYTFGEGCGTNACHNAGDGTTAPAVNNPNYQWGAALADCTICHAAMPTVTGAHTPHVDNTTYVPNSCDDCHTAANVATHIDFAVTYNSTTITTYPGDGSCTNTCHVAGAGDWVNDPTKLDCTDCHSSGYIGDTPYLPTSGLHNFTNTTPHGATLQSGNCINCHDKTAPVADAAHANGVLENAATVTYTFNSATIVSYNPAVGCQAAVACHSDGGDWYRKWTGAVDAIPTNANQPGNAVCDNCHGAPTNFTTPSAWRWDEDADSTDHTDPYLGNVGNRMDQHGSTGAECETCHGWGGVNYNTAAYHNNGFITMNGPASTATGAGYNAVTGGCTIACHTETPFVMNSNSGWTEDYGDFGAGGGACDSCHGNQAGNYWPDGNTAGAGSPTADDQAGLHAEHMVALSAKGIGQTTACGYCHGPEPGTGSYHMDGTATLPQHSAGAWFYKRIIGGGDDKNTPGIFNTTGNAKSTCSNIDCHFDNSYTPHWYASDNLAPEAATLLAAVSGPNPRSVKVTYNSPGADVGLENTSAHRYDVRISATSAADAANYNSATSIPVGGLPATYLRDELTEVYIENLDDSEPSYYVAVRAQDTEGLWGSIATAGPVTATPDTEAPMFYGADKAIAGDEGGSINLYWTAAEDHSMYTLDPLPANRLQQPIRYEIWLKSKARGDLDMVDNTGYNSAILWDGVQTFFTGNAIELEGAYNHKTGTVTTTIQNDITYQMGVRACDYLNNCDTNTRTVVVTPAAARTVPKTVEDYVSGGGTLLTRNGLPGTAAATHALSSTTPLTFYGSSQGWAVDYFLDNFTIQYTEDRTASTVLAELGKWTGTCGGFVASSTITTAAKATGALATFKFGAITPVHALNGESFCIKLSTSQAVSLSYGTAATRGDGVVVEQKANTPPNAIRTPTIGLNGALLQASWTEPLDDGDGLTAEETLHYDIYGSNQNGAAGTWDYVIAENQDWNDTAVVWDTQADGITSGLLAIKIRPGDGFAHTAEGVGTTIFNGFGPATAIDKIAPSQVTDLQALPRPKQGTMNLRWTCPGDDYFNNGRADHYEVRYSTAPIANFNTATLVENAPPYPDFGGHVMDFEVTGLPQETPLYFALKVFDEQELPSPMSNVFGPVNSGPHCGMCHTTGPSIVESAGNHKLHGFTLNDCDKCHNDGITPVSSFGLDHQDGVVKMGYGPGGAVAGIIVDQVTYNSVVYTNNGLPMGAGGDYVMYEDTSGFGGFGEGRYVPQGDGTDNGSCFNFGAMGVGGCHGPAGSDPDGAGGAEYPSFETPDWTTTANLDCGRCHGNPNRDETVITYPSAKGYKLDPYGRDFDGTLANAGVVPDQIIGSPGADNRGGWNYSSASVDERKYIGQHEKHLNYSFRFSKGDSCNLCHSGHYQLQDDLDGKHGDGIIDFELDLNAAGPDAHYNAGTVGVAGTCFNMSPESCHPYDATPKWDTLDTFDCIGCHTMGGLIANIGHYTDTAGLITEPADFDNTLDGGPMLGNCTWCHFAGHPTDDVGGTALILPNNPQVGIRYKSGGIHLRKTPGNLGRVGTPYQTQAQLCWGCHDANGISEWGSDDGSNNVATRPANGNIYDYGKLTTSNWTTATWSSAYSATGNYSATPYFAYKTGSIQSTHSTHPDPTKGQSTVTLVGGQYVESPDAVADLQCHNCHDVHNMNFAKGDEMNGNPYLRGGWLSNPYKEDGAPRGPASGNTTFAATTTFGPVPRGGTAYSAMGGYQIDQNNGHATGPPTKGWVASTAGGLCLLCHAGTNGVDGMDQKASENLWITAGRNGHSNSALGGTALDTQVTDIFSHLDRNPSGAPQRYTADYGPAPKSGNPSMGYVFATGLSSTGVATDYRGDGIRSNYGYGWSSFYASPDVTPTADFPYLGFNWGVTLDSGTVNKGYHAFSCSKCHNPHASRLPKLMITNCLDTKQNTWDDQWAILSGTSVAVGAALSADNSGKRLSNTTSAQNCHRLGDPGQSGTGGGWNLVTPRNATLP